MRRTQRVAVSAAAAIAVAAAAGVAQAATVIAAGASVPAGGSAGTEVRYRAAHRPADPLAPTGRVWDSWAYDPAQHDIVLFGGDGGHGAGGPGRTYGDTWTWNGRSWTERHPATSPPRTDGAAMAWDPATRQMLLFGGAAGPDSGLFGATWAWNGTTWTHLHPAASPSPRRQPDMVYDAALHEIILFGGNADPYSNQTWAWKGTTWTRLHPATSPSPRDTDSLVYDPATRTAIMYGGFNHTGRLSDTWTFNGTTWTRLHPARSPGADSPSWQAAYDTASRQLVLYGGDAGLGGPYSYDTWTWGGGTWTHLYPATIPGPRGFGAMTYDQALRQVVLFGGSNGTADPGSIWNWNGTTWSQSRPAAGPHIATVAGTGTAGFTGDGGPAASAELSQPLGIVVDGAGNLVITDAYNERVRVLARKTGTFYGQPMTARHIYTIAGDGAAGFSGDGGPATSARLAQPNLMAVDRAGNLLIADQGNDRVRVLAEKTGTSYGQAMTAGDIYTVAGGGSSYPGNGGLATSAVLNAPAGVAVDRAGNLLIADDNNNLVRVVAALAGTFYGQAMTAGDIYTIAGTGTAGFSGDGGPATQASLYHPATVTVDSAGNVLTPDSINNRIRVIAARTGTFYRQAMTAGYIYTIAGGGSGGLGDGGPATAATLNIPYDVTIDSAGNLLITDTFNNRIRVVAAGTGTFYQQAMTAGHIYTLAGTGTAGFSGDGGPATRAELSNPNCITVDGPNLLIADRYNNRVRVVTR